MLFLHRNINLGGATIVLFPTRTSTSSRSERVGLLHRIPSEARDDDFRATGRGVDRRKMHRLMSNDGDAQSHVCNILKRHKPDVTHGGELVR